MAEAYSTTELPVGVVGLGLMGSSIAVSLLVAGHPVVAVAPVPGEKEAAAARMKGQLSRCREAGLLERPTAAYESRLLLSEDYADLAGCRLVLECVTEDIDIKTRIYENIVRAVDEDAIIATNTSAIPISLLQRHVTHPARFIGVHWSEPAFATRFMEITCGDQTSAGVASWVYGLAHHWGKEPTLLKKDIRGFITNRLMYAVYRETLSLVERGEATLEDVDKVLRYDAGSWITMTGIFRRMDLLGLEHFRSVFRRIFPLLDNSTTVPEVMQRLVETRAGGTRTCHGMYDYTPEEARLWDEAFAAFNRDIYRLAASYPSGYPETVPEAKTEET